MKKMIGLIGMVSALGYSEPFKVNYHANVNSYKSKVNVGSPNIYKIKSKPYSDVDMKAKAGYLRTLGFESNEQKSVGSLTTMKNEKEGQQLVYDVETSSYHYNNHKVGWLEKGRTVDVNGLESVASAHLSRLLGKEAANFSLADKYQTSIQEGSDLEPRLASVTYRYLRKVDGRMIHGHTHQFMIEIASSGNVKSIEYGDPQLVLVKKGVRTTNRAKLEDMLGEKRVSEKLGAEGDLKTVSYLSADDSYFPEKVGSDLLLKPAMSVMTENEEVNGKSIKYWTHVKALAEDVANLTPSEMDGVAPTKP